MNNARTHAIMGFLNRSTAICGAITAMLSGACALAAEASGVQPSDLDIIVTAQKRNERSLDVPIAITAASGKTLESSGVVNLDQLGQIAPAVVIGRTGAYTQPTIRGISTQAAAAGAENNVAVYVDGIYRPFQRSLSMDLVNLQQIEVLKGPQGTLFGRNATGGALLISTLEPTEELSGKLAVNYASFNDLSATGYISGALIPGVSLSLSGYKRRSDNYIRDVSGFDPAPIDSSAVTAKLVVQPTDALKITLGYEYRETGDPTGLTYNYVARSVVDTIVPAAARSTRRNVTSLTRPNVLTDMLDVYSAHIAWETPLGAINSYTAYQKDRSSIRFDYDGTTFDYNDQRYHEDNDATSQEINLTSPSGGKLSYVLGFFYFKASSGYDSYFITQYPSTTPIRPSEPRIDTDSYAGYADLTWNFTDNWFLTGGLRYSTEKKRLHVIDAAHTTVLADKKATFNSLTPRVVLRYQISPSSNVYASYSQGYKSGAFNYSAAPFLPVEPEELTDYEVGYKAVFGPLRIDTSAYYYDYTNLQVTSYIINNAGQAASQTLNAATARIYGAEFQLNYSPSRDIDVRFSGAYNNAKYRRFPNFSLSLPVAATGLNTSTCLAGPPAVPCTDDISGQTLTRAPKWTFNLGANYGIPVGAGKVTLNANLSYTSAYAPTRADFALDPSNVVNGLIQPSNSEFRYRQGGYALVNLRATWSVNEHLDLAAYVKNLFDQDYLIGSSGNASGDFLTHGEPRIFGVRAEYEF